MTQAILAILLASAMAATLVGRRANNAVSHGTHVPVEEPSTASKADVVHCSGNGRKGAVGGLRRGPPVREAWTNRGRVHRRLGEPNPGQDYGSHQLAAVPRPVLHGGSPKPRDPLRVFRTAYRSDTHARQATFGRLRIPLALPVFRSNDAAYATPHNTALGYESPPR